MTLCVVIPAYRPGVALPELVRSLPAADVGHIVVVDDGGGAGYAAVFAQVAGDPRVEVVHHAVNLGKGAALKTGLNHALHRWGESCVFVTADADGQHLPADILAVARDAAAEPGACVLGSRRFEGPVPLRSRLGNGLTRVVLRAVVGCSLSDTQTGLRAVPAALIPRLLRLRATGYEFELDMLILCKQSGVPIREVPIRTVYLEGNAASHFNPLLDSMRIYFVLLRFAIASVLTACIDYTVFTVAFMLGCTVPQSQVVARAIALLFQYAAAKRAVFYSNQRHLVVFPRYVALVAASGVLSYALIALIQRGWGLNVFLSKLLAEVLVFAANFAIMREFIFVRRPGSGAGDRP
jgi:glycosyltransferase involved in cell wall biosynthesis